MIESMPSVGIGSLSCLPLLDVMQAIASRILYENCMSMPEDQDGEVHVSALAVPLLLYPIVQSWVSLVRAEVARPAA